MAGRRKQPIDLIVANGRKHLTKNEYTERKNSEVTANNDNIKAPQFLSKKEREKFEEIAKELKDINIMSNLDCDILARYIQMQSEYEKITKQINKIKFRIDKKLDVDADTQIANQTSDFYILSKMQIKYAKMCNECARELGLTISSRCKLVIPKQEEKKPINKFLQTG
mgnify:CR=1 FL=1